MDTYDQTPVTLCVANEVQFPILTEQWVSRFINHPCDLSQHIDALYMNFNAQDLAPVDEMRQRLSFVWTRPRVLGYKFLVLHHVQLMNSSMANALLKLLEEPPGYLKCLLLSTSKERVLDTIQSRCVVMEHDVQEQANQWLGVFNQYLQCQLDETGVLKYLMECEDLEACINQLMALIHMLGLHVFNDELDGLWSEAWVLSRKIKSKITWNKANLASEHLILLKKMRRFAQAN